MKCNEDVLFMELLEKHECTYHLEEANTVAHIVQALAEDKHVKKLTPWMQYMQRLTQRMRIRVWVLYTEKGVML